MLFYGQLLRQGLCITTHPLQGVMRDSYPAYHTTPSSVRQGGCRTGLNIETPGLEGMGRMAKKPIRSASTLPNMRSTLQITAIEPIEEGGRGEGINFRELEDVC